MVVGGTGRSAAIDPGRTSEASRPVPERHWSYTQSIGLIREIFDDRMVPMTLDGIDRGMKLLSQ